VGRRLNCKAGLKKFHVVGRQKDGDPHALLSNPRREHRDRQLKRLVLKKRVKGVEDFDRRGGIVSGAGKVNVENFS